MLSRTRWEIYTLTPGTKKFTLESNVKKIRHVFSDRPSAIVLFIQVLFEFRALKNFLWI